MGTKTNARYAALGLGIIITLAASACSSSGGSSGTPSAADSGAPATTATTATTAANPPASSAAGPQVDTNKTYILGSSADFPPIVSRDISDPSTVVGIEAAIATAALEHEGLKYKWKVISFQGLVPALKAGKVDILISGVYKTADREKAGSFVDYLYDGLSVLTSAKANTDVKGWPDLCGKSVGVLVGTAVERDVVEKHSKDSCTSQSKPAIKISAFQGLPDELLQIDNRKLDAVLDDSLSLGYLQGQKPDQYRVAFDVTDERNIIGAMFRTSDSALLEKFKAGVEWFQQSGGLQKAAEKWHVSDKFLSAD